MQLSLINFQAHKESVFDFVGSLICVVGANHAGKSSVTRAFRWLFYDGLRGSRFVHKGADSSSVLLEYNGVGVERCKGKQKNSYRVGSASYEAIKTGVPPEVEQALSVHKVRVDKDCALELNVVRQSESPFLVGDVTGSMRAKALNVLTGYHVLDSAIRETNTLLRRHNQELEQLQQRKSGLAGQLGRFSSLDHQSVAVASAKADFSAMQAKIDVYKAKRSAISHRQEFVQRLSGVKVPEVSIGQIDVALQKLEHCYQVKTMLEARSFALASFATAQSKAVSLVPGKFDEIVVKIDWCQSARERLENYNRKVGALHGEVSRLTVVKLTAEVAESSVRALIGQPCPTCGQLLSEVCCA